MTLLGNVRRRLSSGLELRPDCTAHARVWAPACRSVSLVLERREGETTTFGMDSTGDGFFECLVERIKPGDRYRYLLDGERKRPDPVSRFQPDGPHGPSEVIDPDSFKWTDFGWRGITGNGQVIYEMHVGTFTIEGTWRAAAEELEELARLGVTVIEVMPIADFAGRFGWGYDGVNLYAPTRLYGRPDDLRAFIDRAHATGIGVILDVVYNHFGPDGNYLAEFSPDYFTDRYENDWGQAVNFEGPRPARDFFIENAKYWIEEFHFDGLRLDATQDIHDASAVHVLQEIAAAARAAAGDRQIYLVAENEPQRTQLVRPVSTGGFGIDALWNDDYHHTALVALVGRREAYYFDYKGSPQEFVSSARYGYLYQGQWYAWQKQPRGTPALDLPGTAFVTYLENHDQVANSPSGRRLHQVASPGRLRALTALTLLGPGTPMLFQGQEFASSAPFLYFADHRGELRGAIREGRREFLKQFRNVADPDVQAALPAPDARETFARCRLDFSERETHAEAYCFHRDLLHLRRTDHAVAAAATCRPEGAVLAESVFVLRYDGGEDGDRLLLVNLGPDLDLSPIPEPLLAPPEGTQWTLVWSSEAVAYGGLGRIPFHQHAAWHIPGEAAMLLAPEAASIVQEADEDDASDDA